MVQEVSLKFMAVDLEKIYTQNQWYTQGTAGTPLLLSTSASSGFILQREGLALGYKHFLFRFMNDQAEMLYDMNTLHEIWDYLLREILSNEKFLLDIKNRYDQTFESFEPFFYKVRHDDLSKYSEGELIQALHQCVIAQRDSVGLGHILEPISIIGSDVARDRITKEARDEEGLNKKIAALFEPTERSFIAQEDDDLVLIASSNSNIDKLLEDHLEKYYWLENTYASTNTVTKDSLCQRIKQIKKENRKENDPAELIDKEQLIEVLGLSGDTQKLIEILNYCTLWQDERKMKILKALSAFDAVLYEIARRSKVDHKDLRYIGPHEALGVQSLSEITKYKHELQKRRPGCYCYMQDGQEQFVTGKDYENIFKIHHKEISIEKNVELRGMTASLGTALGEVRVCTTMESLGDFPEGAVLVAHMTRPEYAPAMKKAAAIITDEGGITSHAAIVSRELGVPCIIGTKNATKVFKDGDTVEVRANHGFVRKIN